MPRVYLRTKLVPDLSAEIEGRVLEHSEPPVHLGISDQSIPSSSASAEAALEAQDRMIQWAQDMLVESLEPLPPTSTSQNTAILNKSSGGFTLTPDSRRKALQSSLSWMSSGTDAST